MDILESSEIDELVRKSTLVSKYNDVIDRESAFEILDKKMMEIQEEQEKAELPKPTTSKSSAKEEPSMIDALSKNTMVRQLGRTIFRELTRGILGSFTRKR
jgi:hypothetical protein